MVVEESANIGDHTGAARRIVAAAWRGQSFADGVGPIQGIVQAAPTGVGGIQRVARVVNGYHELRAGDVRDLRVDTCGLHLKGGTFRGEIADLARKRL